LSITALAPFQQLALLSISLPEESIRLTPTSLLMEGDYTQNLRSASNERYDAL
jgi:hypothetical protein